jgi:hypothetical protein
MASVVPIDRPGVSHSASQIISQGDLIYANIRVNHDPSFPEQIIRYDVTRAAPIIHDPSQYEMTILRFSLPSSFVYLFRFKPEFPHLVTLGYDGAYITKDVVDFYEPAYAPNPQNFVFTYNQYLDALNRAIVSARVDLLAAKPALPAVGSPRFLLDNATGLFTCRADASWGDQTDPVKYSANTATLEMSYEIFRLFYSIPVFQNVGEPVRFAQILFRDNGNNLDAGQLSMTSEVDTRGVWNAITQIAFDSSIPIESEILPGQNAGARRILTDFEPDRSKAPDRSAYQYQPSGERRWYSMRSSTPLHRLNVIPRWIDADGDQQTFTQGAGDYFSMKILFRKKAYARPGVAPAYFDQPSARF